MHPVPGLRLKWGYVRSAFGIFIVVGLIGSVAIVRGRAGGHLDPDQDRRSDADRDRAGQPAGRAQLEQLPLTLSFENLNGEEKIGHLDHELTMDGMPKGDDSQVGDLGYYAPWGNVVLYYGDVGHWDGIARIGTIHGAMSIISDQTGDFTATLERADGAPTTQGREH